MADQDPMIAKPPSGLHGVVGRPVLRFEDHRMLTGSARYLSDTVEGMAHAPAVVGIVRSQVAHGTIRSVAFLDTAPAGVELLDLDVFASLPGRVPVLWRLGGQTQMDTRLGDPHVRYVGQPVGLVIGPTEVAVVDAMEQVVVDIDPLPTVVTMNAATDPDAPLLHPDLGSNVLAQFCVGDDETLLETVLTDCDHVLTHTFDIGRLAGAPMEGRGVVVIPDGDRLTIHTSTQAPHAVRDAVAEVLGLRLEQIRVTAPDVGGGFGVKDHPHDDELLVIAAASMLDRPLRWHESRNESLTVTTQARDERHDVTVGFDADGTLRALRVDGIRNAGAHFAIFGGGPLFTCLGLLPGPYRWEAYHGTGTLVATNQVPTGAYRGFGQTQACFLRERMVDLVARHLGVDPVALRLHNLVGADEQPWSLRTPITFDNGDYQDALHRVRAVADSWPEPAADGRRRGIGYCTYVQMAGIGNSTVNEAIGLAIGGFESAILTIGPDASVTVRVGTSPHGQGHETSFAQLVADQLGVDPRHVVLVHSDTDASPYSAYGTAASRSMAVGGAAIVQAAERLANSLRLLAAERLEASEADIELITGTARVRGGGGEVPIAELTRWAWRGAALPGGLTPGLEERASYDPSNATFSYGSHACRVAVDVETGETEIERYAVVHDCGTIVNPLIVEGQVHGGIAQGAGAALLEQVIVDEYGQQTTASFLDYLVPDTTFLPMIEVLTTSHPSPHTPGGMKGMGEGGTNGSFACVVNAVAAAVPEVADRLTSTPISPQRLWSLLQSAQGLDLSSSSA